MALSECQVPDPFWRVAVVVLREGRIESCSLSQISCRNGEFICHQLERCNYSGWWNRERLTVDCLVVARNRNH